MISFNKSFECEYGVCEQIGPQVRRIIARNPSPFTFYGTGTYIIGEGEIAIIDPGPNDLEHISAIISATRKETITHILVTHTHLDHSPGTRLLKEFCDAPSYGFGTHGEGKYLRGDVVEAGGDWDFKPDIRVKDNDIIEGKDWSVECVHTPGHTSNHVCFQYQEQQTLFCGDHIMAWSTSIISPPDGDLSDYLKSLRKLLTRDDRIYWPCHGPAITEPKPFVQSFIDHRLQRVREVRQCLEQGIYKIEEMLPSIYTELDTNMYPAAARSILSTLIYLIDQKQVKTDSISLDSIYRPI